MKDRESSKKVVIFGVGECCARLLEENLEYHSIVGFIDNDNSLNGTRPFGKGMCYLPKMALELEYDSIVITGEIESIRLQMLKQLLDLGIPREQVEFYPVKISNETYFDPRIKFVHSFSKFTDEQEIIGNVAECGVNDGAFAKYINRYFLSKRLYLFDTFEGFTSQDIEVERSLNDGAFIDGSFNNVGGWNHSIDLVLSKMTTPDQVIIKKGRVPETFAGIDDTFCFVNLDMDLYAPMLAATKFFWEKMSTGGVLLLHDYRHPELPGVKRAVDDFERELGRKVSKLPFYGSIILVKQ